MFSADVLIRKGSQGKPYISMACRDGHWRIKELEREVIRKDKALAETTALLVLSKKLSAVFGEGADE